MTLKQLKARDLEKLALTILKEDKLHAEHVSTLNSSILLSLTEQCPLNCAHCCVDSNPHKKNEINGEKIVESLEELLKSKVKCKPKLIVCTGGEPFLKHDLLSKITDLSSKHCVEVATMTGCYWGRTKFLASSTLKRFDKLPHHICLSIDKYHIDQIGFNAYLNCLDALSKYQSTVRFHFSYEAELNLAIDQEIYDFLFEVYSKYQCIKSIWPQPIRRSGRAVNLECVNEKTQDKRIERELSIFEHGKPCHLINAPNIDTDLTYYPCCGDWHDSQKWSAEEKAILSVGSLTKMLRELNLKHANSYFLSFIKNRGPRRALELLDLEVPRSENICDHCHKLCANLKTMSKSDIESCFSQLSLEASCK